jgi:hypothetical protein
MYLPSRYLVTESLVKIKSAESDVDFFYFAVVFFLESA